jgi:arylsulfatase A-like enzyme
VGGTLALLAALALAAGAPTVRAAALEPARPNIVVFLADDMGLGDVRAYHPASNIPTPNLDRLASEGIRFTDAHSPSSVCTPSRYGLLTGRYPFRSRLRGAVLTSAYEPPLLTGEPETVAALLQRAGYATAMFGKWHLGMDFAARSGGVARAGVDTSKFTTRDVDFAQPIIDGPLQHGFDVFFGVASSLNHGPYAFIRDAQVTTIPRRIRAEKSVGERPFREGWIVEGWRDDAVGTRIAEEALAYITGQVGQHPEQPFFLYYAATANHFPYVPPEAFRGQRIRGRGGDDHGMPARNDMVVENDVIVGELLARLGDPNQDGDPADSVAQNTLVIVTSDNGSGVAPPAPLRGKKVSIYEGGHRVPFIARWPDRIPAGVETAALIGLVDLYATLATLTGGEPAPRAARDSQDVSGALLGRADAALRGPLLQQNTGAGRVFALREGRWKLVMKNDRAIELFDLENDPGEADNEIGVHPDVTRRLERELRAILASEAGS